MSGTNFIFYNVGGMYQKEEVPLILDFLREKLSGQWVVALGGNDEVGKLFYVVGTDGTVSAREVSGTIAEITGGQGGGSDRIARGGGGDPSKWSQAEEAVIRLIKGKS